MSGFDASLAEFGARADDLRQQLFYADATALAVPPVGRDLWAQLRAACYVWLASALERFVNSFVERLIEEINAVGLPARELRLSLFAMGCGSELDRLSNVRGLKMWGIRAALFPLVDANTVASLDIHHKPLDGRTIEPEHLAVIWTAFGLPGDCLPNPRLKLALIDLSRARNELAHGAEEPVRFGRTKTKMDVCRAIENVQEVVLHVVMSGETYLSSAAYRR